MSMVRDRAESTEIQTYEPQYTWTFDERALLIRLYLWVYQPSDPKNTTFCRLFWSTVCMPFMLPLRLLMLLGVGLLWTAKMVGTGIAWPVKKIPIGEFLDAFDNRRQRAQRARALAAHAAAIEKLRKEEEARAERSRLTRERMEQENLGWWLWLHEYDGETPPKFKSTFDLNAVVPNTAVKTKIDKPKKVKEGPSVQEKFATAVAERADRISAFFQVHPEIGQKIDAFLTRLGRIIVRFVFYPLMVLIPLSFMTFVGYEIYEHRKGLGSGTESVAVPTGHAAAVAGGASWEAIVGLVISLAIAGIVFLGLGWLIMALDRFAEGTMHESAKPKRPVVLHHQSAIGMQVDKATAIAWTGLKGTGRGIAICAEFFGRFLMEVFGRAGGPLGKVGSGIGKVCYVTAICIAFAARWIWWGVTQVGKGVRASVLLMAAVVAAIFGLVGLGARSIGGATTTTGKFFIMGHHTLKSRTCPKIVIKSGDE